MPKTKSTKELTAERGRHYGHPREHFAATQAIFTEWLRRRSAATGAGAPTTPHERALWHAVYMICDKLARAAQDPMHVDNWNDIQGYARTAKMVLGLEE